MPSQKNIGKKIPSIYPTVKDKWAVV